MGPRASVSGAFDACGHYRTRRPIVRTPRDAAGGIARLSVLARFLFLLRRYGASLYLVSVSPSALVATSSWGRRMPLSLVLLQCWFLVFLQDGGFICLDN